MGEQSTSWGLPALACLMKACRGACFVGRRRLLLGRDSKKDTIGKSLHKE